MRVNVAKVGMEVMDKLTGIAYKIDATDESINAEITKAEATEILEEEETREPKKVTINSSNDRTFMVTKWVEDTALHTANVVNGILSVDGKDVVMGSIVAKNILKVFPGVVIFTASNDEDESYDVVYKYTPSRDDMTMLGRFESKAVVIEDTETRVVYGFSLTKDVEEKDGDTVTKKTVFDRAGLYVLTKKNGLTFTCVAGPSQIHEEYDEDEDDYYDVVEETSSEVENYLGLDLADAVMAQGDKYLYIPQKDDDKETTYQVYRVTDRASYNGNVKMPGKLTDVTANRTSAKNLGKAIFSGEGFVKVDDVVIRSNDLKGYIYLVDANRSRETDTNTYVFAAEDRKMKTVTRKNTKDRGEIVTIS